MQAEIDNESRNQYETDGYTILRGYFPNELLDAFERAVVQVHAFQGLKVGAICEQMRKGSNPLNYDRVEDLDQLLHLFEEGDTKAGSFASGLIQYSPAAARFVVGAKLHALAASLMACPEDLVVCPPSPSVLANLPEVSAPTRSRLLYQWHSERSYIPRRRNFLTFWFPLFRGKSADNGTMYVCRGSQTKVHEYTSYRGDTTSGNAYFQAATPEYELTEFEKVAMVCERGDLVVFKDNLVHRSSVNTTAVASYTGLVRMYDYSRDLILNKDPIDGGAPYGRQDIQVVEY